MILYGELTKLEPQADGSIKVHGVASTAARDSAGEIVTAEAMKAALPGYLAFGAIREMHAPRAAGSALEAAVDAHGATRIVAHVVDPVAVKKVQAGVYKGLSIGGKVLARDPSDPTVITQIRLDEISLVDRPCNPDAVIDLWKAQAAPSNEAVRAQAERLAAEAGRPGKRNDYLAKAREMLSASPPLQSGGGGREADGGGSREAPTPQSPLHHPSGGPPPPLRRGGEDTLPAHEQTTNGDDQVAHGGFADGLAAKYPLDTPERIRAAWAAVCAPQALAQYGYAEIAAMQARIAIAWRELIDPAGPPALAPPAAQPPAPAETPGAASELGKLLQAQGEIAVLTKRIDDQAAEIERLKRSPLPPRAAGSHLAKAIAKEHDGGQAAPAPLSADDFARALDAMAPSERAHLLMKAALSRPISL